MKKIKILPSILMLTLCVAILGVGVFAVAPTQNTISGSITINASNTPVSIELFIDNVSQGDPVDVRSGKTFDIGELAFNTTGVNTVEQVKNRKVTLKVTNLSTTQSLGVYFMDPDSALGESGLADIDNIMLERNVYANGAEETDANKIATAYFTPYYYIGVNDGNTTTNGTDDFEFDTVEMNINFECFQLFNESKSYDFNYQLNIEPYEGNVGNSELVQTEPEYDEENDTHVYDDMEISQVQHKLIKIAEDVTTIKTRAFYNNSTTFDHMVVIPSSLKNISGEYLAEDGSWDNFYYAFAELSNIKAMSINANTNGGNDADCCGIVCGGVIAFNVVVPEWMCTGNYVERVEISSKVKTIGSSAFLYCDSLTIIEIANSDTVVVSDAFLDCQSISLVRYETSGEGYTYKDGTLTITKALTTDTGPSWTNINPLIFNIEWEENAKTDTTIIPQDAFYSCYNLTDIEIPEGVTSIGDLAFYCCYSLTSIEIPSGVTRIGTDAFESCDSLTSVKIKSGVDLESAYVLPTCYKYGYTFNGWYTTTDTSGTKIISISDEKYEADTTYYAVFTAK